MRIEGGTVRLVDLSEEGVIRDLDAVDVTFTGPAVLLPSEETRIKEPTWDTGGGGPEAVVWEIPAGRQSMIGGIVLYECSLVRCRFVRVGVGLSKQGTTNLFRGLFYGT